MIALSVVCAIIAFFLFVVSLDDLRDMKWTLLFLALSGAFIVAERALPEKAPTCVEGK